MARSYATGCTIRCASQPALSWLVDITGQFETHKPGIAYACMRGDIEKTAGLTIREPDGVDDARPVHFTKWKPFDLDAVSHRAGLAPASAETDPGMGGPVDANASLRSDPELIPEAAE